MAKVNTSARRLWRILLPAEAAVFALVAALRLFFVLTFRMAYLPLLLLLFAALDGVLLAVYYDAAHRHDAAYRGKRRVLLLLALLALLSSLPLFTNYLLKGHDIQFHLFRIEGVRDGLADGQFPVRIHPNTLYGNGYANPAFYPELLLYFPALLRLSGFSVMAAYKTFLFALNLLTAFTGYYAAARIFRSVKLGLAGSAFYTLSLYRLVNLYTRAAIGEVSAMAFLPLVAVGIYRILFDDTEKSVYRRAFLPLLIGMTGLLATHLLTCEMVLPLLLVFCAVFGARTFKKKRLLSIVAAAVGTALLSLAFLAPMLDFMGADSYRVFDYSTMNLSNEAVNVAQLFPLFPNGVGESNAASMGAAGEMPLGVGFVCLVLLGVYPALAKHAAPACDRDCRRLSRFCYIGALALLFMSTNLFPWAALYDLGGPVAKIAGMLQFPWRLLSMATLLFTFVFCRCLALLPSLSAAPLRRALACALCLPLLLSSAAYMDDLVQTSDALFIHSNADLDQTRSVGDAEYLPQGAAAASAYREDGPTLVGGGLTIEDFVRDGTTIAFMAANGGSAQSVDLPLILYPGYVARDGGGNALPITKGEAARIRVTIPAMYEGVVTVRFMARPLWRAAEAVTLVTALALALWLLRERRRSPAEAYLSYEAPLTILE